MRNFFSYWLPVILWMAVIFSLSAIPLLQSGLPSFWDLILRKLAHAFVFAVLTLLLSKLLLMLFPNEKRWIVFLYAMVFSLFYAVSDEVHQMFVFGRHGSILDVFIDLLGIMLVPFFLSSKSKVAKRLATYLGISQSWKL